MIDYMAIVFTVTTILAVVSFYTWLFCNGMPKSRIGRNSLFACIFLAVTAWLWSPWAAYGLMCVWRTNIGFINDLAQPERVLPPTVNERPSAADYHVEYEQ